MSDARGVSGKICVFCGEDCAGQPRGKDPAGRYYHLSCLDEAKRQREETSGTAVSAVKRNPTGGTPVPPPTPSLVADDDYGLLGDLLEEEGDVRLPAAQHSARLEAGPPHAREAGPPHAREAGPPQRQCANCGAPLAADAILCVSCGFNVQSGEIM